MTTDKDSTKRDGPVLIKKYANRRLYHTERSSYVTLDDLAQMVKDDVEFVVQDAKTGEDITRSVLNQIIFDAENSGQMMLPAGFLREIIRLYGDSMQGIVPSYLESAMQNFLQNQDELRKAWESNLGNNPAMMGFEQISKMNQEWMSNAMEMMGAMNPLIPRSAPKPAKTGASESEIDELKSQLRDMQNTIAKLANK